MSKVSINESTLTNIGAAIREMTGKTDLIAPGDMPAEIRAIETGGGGDIEVEPVVLTGNCDYACMGQMASIYIEMFGDKVSTKDVTSMSSMFMNNNLSEIPFDINCKGTSYGNAGSMFKGAKNLKQPPKILNAYPDGLIYFFSDCNSLESIPEDFIDTWNLSRVRTYAYSSNNGMFDNCYKLKTVPTKVLKELYSTTTPGSYSYYFYSYLFNNCYNLREAIGVGVTQSNISNLASTLGSMLNNCGMLSRFTFDVNDDGTPKTANWQGVAWAFPDVGVAGNATLFKRNTGLTDDTKVTDDTSYQALKNNPDYWTTNWHYSHFNHDSAVELINSLPDCGAGAGNSITFPAELGQLTDAGGVNTLTDEEKAVATAKGWAVKFTS